MLTKRELEKAIEECEDAPKSFDNIHKLATLYNVYDRMYSEQEKYPMMEKIEEVVIGNYGNSNFLTTIDGMYADDVWLLMDELMETLMIVNPRLYDGVMRRLKGQI